MTRYEGYSTDTLKAMLRGRMDQFRKATDRGDTEAAGRLVLLIDAIGYELNRRS